MVYSSCKHERIAPYGAAAAASAAAAAAAAAADAAAAAADAPAKYDLAFTRTSKKKNIEVTKVQSTFHIID